MPPKTGTREVRVLQLEDVEVRDGTDGKPPVITGLACRYNVWSEPIGGAFLERFAPGAFTKTLQESDVRSLFNHKEEYVLGRTKSGTLVLEDSTRGLRYTVTPPETQLIRDLVVEPMKRGDIDQSSFAFRAVKDEWEEPSKQTDGMWRRTVLEAQLFDVSPVTFPAYLSSTAQVRSLLQASGLDAEALAALLVRSERGISLSASDVDLVNGSIAVLRSLLPSEPVPDVTPVDHSGAPQAGRSVDHLRRRLELLAAS